MRIKILLGLLSLFIPKVALAQNYVSGEVIVKLKGQYGSKESYAFLGRANSDMAMRLRHSWPKLNMYHFAVPQGQTVETAIQQFKKDPRVLIAEPNFYVQKSADTGLQQTFSVQDIQSSASAQSQVYMATSADIGVQSVWSGNVSAATTKPTVAVIDTGLDTTHPVMVSSQAVWTNPNEIPGNGIDDDNNGYVDDVHGWNFVDDSPTMYDDDDHGTHVTGIILSIDQNIYTTPLRPSNIQIMPLKFLNGQGVGVTSDAIRAIYYAANNGASVINNSWGGPDYSAALQDAVAYSYSKGALFVAAAGNSATDNDSTPMYPASFTVPNVLAVAATTDTDDLATFSNFGATSVPVGSPGVYILSTIPNDSFATMSGTSMATPFVSGTAALMKVASPAMLGYQLKSIILGQIDTRSQLQGKVTTGGRLDSANAVNFAKTAVVETTQPAYQSSYLPDQELSTDLVGATGCGMVRVLMSGSDDGKGGGRGSGGSRIVSIARALSVIIMLIIPLLVLLSLRLREPQNRRAYERFKVNSDVRISVGGRELVGSVSSLSLGGAQVNTSALLQDGGLVSLTISSPNGEEKVEVAGRVVWSSANKAYGVAFYGAPQSVLARISNWTAVLKRAS